MSYLSIIHHINAAGIGASATRAMLIITEHVDPASTSMAVFQWKEISALLGTNRPLSRGRVRALMIELSQANLINYHTNSVVMVQFSDQVRADFIQWRAENDQIRADNDHVKLTLDAPRAENDQIRADNDHVKLPRAENDQERAENDQERAENDHTNYSSLVSSSNTTQSNERTNSEGNSANQILALLTDPDVGLSPADAKAFEKNTLEWTLRHVFAWRRDIDNGKSTGLGGLINRMRNRWSAPPVSAEEKRSALYQRHAPSQTEQAESEKTKLRAYQLEEK